MKIKFIWYILPIFMFFACEDEEEMDELNIVGSWNITSQHDYENSNCTGQYESSLDTLKDQWGENNVSSQMDFTNSQFTSTYGLSLNDEDLCNAWTENEGSIDDTGDSCLITYNSFSYGFSLDTLCIELAGGTYSNGNCDIIESVTFDYLLDGDAITFTEYAGTDSAAITLGIISITNNILNITVSDDSSCTVIIASKL